jgi:hypothetical protein
MKAPGSVGIRTEEARKEAVLYKAPGSSLLKNLANSFVRTADAAEPDLVLGHENLGIVFSHQAGRQDLSACRSTLRDVS